MRKRFLDDAMIIAAVIRGAARDGVGKLIPADQVTTADFETVEIEKIRDFVHRALDRIVRRRLAECPHGLLHGLVGGDGHGAILNAPDSVRPDNGADGFTELKGRAPRIGADIVERGHLHRADNAGRIECEFNVKQPLRPMGVATRHVLQPVLYQAYRTIKPSAPRANEDRFFDSALY